MTARYDTTFRNEAVKLALTKGQSIAQTARDLGIKEGTLYNWVSQRKQSAEKVPSEEFKNNAELVNELNRLRKENARLKEEREILKKAAADSSGRCNKRSKFIKQHQERFDIHHLCEMFAVSRSGYYAWHKRPLSTHAKQNKSLTQAIMQIFTESRQTYGYRRVHQALKQQGQPVSKHRVARLMRQEMLTPKTKKKFKATTNSNHSLPIYQNILQREFTPTRANQVWSSDITYIWTGEGWLYLAVVLDLFSRQIIGWSMQNRMTEDLVINALKMALFRRKINSPLLFHSDRGSQYASYAFQQLLIENGISCSMSRKGNCWDNSPTESFFGSLKVECIYQQSIKTREEAKQMIFDYIEVFYNRQRLHSTLNYLSPIDYEKSVANL